MIADTLLVLLLALSGRTKGGFLALDPPGSGRNFKARAQWAALTGLAIGCKLAALGSAWAFVPLGLAGVLLAWAGGLFDRDTWQDLGMPGRFAWWKVAKGAGLGVGQYALLVAPVAVYRGDVETMLPAFLGLLQPLWYWLPWRFVPLDGYRRPVIRGTRLIDNPNALAELLTHGGMGLAIVWAAHA